MNAWQKGLVLVWGLYIPGFCQFANAGDDFEQFSQQVKDGQYREYLQSYFANNSAFIHTRSRENTLRGKLAWNLLGMKPRQYVRFEKSFTINGYNLLLELATLRQKTANKKLSVRKRLITDALLKMGQKSLVISMESKNYVTGKWSYRELGADTRLFFYLIGSFYAYLHEIKKDEDGIRFYSFITPAFDYRISTPQQFKNAMKHAYRFGFLDSKSEQFLAGLATGFNAKTAALKLAIAGEAIFSGVYFPGYAPGYKPALSSQELKSFHRHVDGKLRAHKNRHRLWKQWRQHRDRLAQKTLQLEKSLVDPPPDAGKKPATAGGSKP